MNRNEKLRFLLTLVVVAVVFFAIGIGLTASFNKVAPVTAVTATDGGPITPPPPGDFLLSSQKSFRSIVAAVSPAVCTVEVITRVPGMQNHPFEMFGGDPFERFFGPSPGPRQQQPQPQEPREYEVPSSGSGFLVSSDGYILTNNHVVQNADEVKVVLNGKDEYDAEIMVLDEATDVAVLKIEGDGPFPYLQLGDSDAIWAGDWVMAIGNPFGYLDHTVTVGVISAKNREQITGQLYEDFLQTDAAINFGNSGGPLVDIYGHAVGINTAISAQGTGVGFAVPINMAKQVYEDFIDFGEVRRGWIGITIEEIDDIKAEELGLDSTEGALVTSVSKDDPADKAGIEKDDLIIKIDGERIASPTHLMRIIAGKDIGESIGITLIRDGREMTLEVIPGQRSDKAIIRGGENVVTIDELGITIRDFNDEIRDGGNLPDDVKGVIIVQVDARSNAANKGLKAGVIITHIDDEKVESVEEFMEVFSKYSNADKVVIDVLYVRADGSTDADVVALKLN